jgi:HD-GYP domain-containing protein (c-di-GMP phosphodiesterase class II)
MTEKHLLRLLIIEDDPQDAELIRRELERINGWRVEMVRVDDEKTFREALHRQTFDLMICDFVLPAFSVDRVVEILDDFGIDIPLILMSGTVKEESIIHLFRKGRVLDFVHKDVMYKLRPALARALNLSKDYESILIAWARALELRDKETEGHSERVAELTVRLARQMGVSETEIIHIRRGALMHDVGKLGVPDEVLLKQGNLTEKEWILMMQHPQMGYDMLSGIQYLKRSLDIPLRHHERWDGTGYPDGLRNESIPFPARMFAVVDVFDALTSDRPYRQAIPQSEALAQIRDKSGIHFDPQVVRVFLSMFREEESS